MPLTYRPKKPAPLPVDNLINQGRRVHSRRKPSAAVGRRRNR
jgi:hypothetical protein